MAANFPDSPSTNDTFTSNGLTFTWNGSAWKLDPSSGTKGDKGQKGEVGDTGDKGQKGQKGEIGDKGQKGEIGATGGTGGTGQKGQKGEVGEKGTTGAAAAKGQKGEVGATGTGGSAGDKGSIGEKGDKGAPSTVAGDKGQKGEVGDKGSIGAGGSGGDKGQKGEEGPQGGGAPVGQIVAWSGSAGSLPSGYFLCDGSAISRSTYAALFGVVGTTHGSGNGSSTFNIPDLRDRFIVGASNSTGDSSYPGISPGSTGGSADAVIVSHSHNHNLSGSTNNAGSHSHNVSGNSNNAGSHAHNRDKWGGNFGGSSGATVFRNDANGNRSTGNAGSHSHTISGNSNNAGGHSHNVSINSGSITSQGESGTNKNLPPYYSLAYIIQFAQGGTTAKGQKGEQGATGSGGSTGDKGQKGEAGDKGAASSVQGPTGDKGQKGEIGATGSGGSTGSDGAKGQKGEIGVAGDKGATGTGDKGQKGELNDKGQKGEVGTTGTIFASGTRMLFQQTAAPTGWTKDTSSTNRALRLVSGTVGTGGVNTFTGQLNSTVTTSGGSVSNHTLTTTQLAAHFHDVWTRNESNIDGSRSSGSNSNQPQGNWYTAGGGYRQVHIGGGHYAPTSGNTGGGSAHNHGFTNPNFNLNVAYTDVIIAEKN